MHVPGLKQLSIICGNWTWGVTSSVKLGELWSYLPNLFPNSTYFSKGKYQEKCNLFVQLQVTRFPHLHIVSFLLLLYVQTIFFWDVVVRMHYFCYFNLLINLWALSLSFPK